MYKMFSGVKASRRQVARLMVWFAFLTVLLGGAVLSDSNIGREPIATASSAAPASVAEATLSSAPTFVDPGTSVNAAGALPMAPDSTTTVKPVDNINYLPAWRWSNFELDVSSESDFLSAQGALRSVGSSFASLFFMFASLIWTVLLGLIKFGLTADFLTGAAPMINTGIATLASKLAILLGVVWAFVLFRMIKQIMAGHVQKAVVGMLMFSVAMGAIFAMGNASEGGPSINKAGTLPNYAQTAISTLDKSANSIGSAFGVAGDYSAVSGGPQGTDSLSCQRYVDKLHERYAANNVSNTASNTASLATISKLWESTFLSSWTTAQFGTPNPGQLDFGARVACRQLDNQSSIPVIEQREVANLVLNNAPFADKFWGPYNEPRYLHMAVTAWAACTYSSGQPDFGVNTAWNDQGPEGNPINAGECNQELKAEGGIAKKSAFNIFYEHSTKMKTDSPEHIASQKWNNAYYGANTGDRLVQGLLALIVAGIFFASLGFISLGLIAAQFMLIILLILAVITAMLLGVGASGGKKLLKLTGTTAASKFMFVMLIAFLTEITSLGQRIVAVMGSGILVQILSGLMPILALLLLTKMLKSVGMDSILKPSGALSFMAASSLAATRDQSMMNMGRSVQSQTAKATAKTGEAAKKSAKASKKIGQKLGAAANDKWSNSKDRKEEFRNKADSELTEKERRVRDIEEKVRLERIARYGPDGQPKGILGGVRGRTSDYLSFLRNGGAQAAGAVSLANMAGAAGTAVKGASLAGIGVGALGSATTAIAGGFALPIAAPALVGAAGLAAYMGYKKAQDKRTVKPEAYAVKPDTYAANTPAASSSIAENMRTVQRAQIGPDRLNKERRLVETTLNSAKTRKVGEGFEGFGSVAQHAGAAVSYSQELGLSRGEVIVGNNGLMVPAPMKKSVAKSKLDMKNLSNGIHWIDEETRAYKTQTGPGGETIVETDEQYVTRMHVVLQSRGLLTASGEHVNVFEKLGLNPEDSGDAARIQKWMDGEEDKKLDSKVFKAADSVAEARLIQAAAHWMNDQEKMQEVRRNTQEIMLLNAVEEASKRSQALANKANTVQSNFKIKNDTFANDFAALTAQASSPDSNIAKKAETERRALRKAWEKATNDAVQTHLDRLDTVNTLMLDIEAPSAGTEAALIEMAEKRVKKIEEAAAEIDRLQSAAYGGSAQAVAALADGISALEAQIQSELKSMDEKVSASKKQAADVARTRAQERARHGEMKRTPRASDLIPRGGRFPG